MSAPTVGSLFSGIGGMDLGLERAGWSVRWQCEIDPWRRQILERHWPGLPHYADVRDIGADAPQVDLIAGGFPCQDVSVAGQRAGLAGARSGLFWEFARVAGELRPAWLLLENVPGLLTSRQGHDFLTILTALGELGYGLAWRVLDSRYFGVAQRRSRVFIVGHLGAPVPLEVLFEPEGSGGHPAPGGAARSDLAYALKASAGSGGRGGGNAWNFTYVTRDAVRCKAAHGRRNDASVETFVTGFDLAQITSAANYSNPKPGDPQPPLAASGQPMIAYTLRGAGGFDGGEDGTGRGTPLTVFNNGQGNPNSSSTDLAFTLDTQANLAGIAHADRVRRLTPTECLRLQALPDDWLGPPNGPPNGPRYAAIGDAVTASVAEWIGRRLLQAHVGQKTALRGF